MMVRTGQVTSGKDALLFIRYNDEFCWSCDLMRIALSHLVNSGDLGSFIQQQLHDVHVPHLGSLDQRCLSVL